MPLFPFLPLSLFLRRSLLVAVDSAENARVDLSKNDGALLTLRKHFVSSPRLCRVNSPSCVRAADMVEWKDEVARSDVT